MSQRYKVDWKNTSKQKINSNESVISRLEDIYNKMNDTKAPVHNEDDKSKFCFKFTEEVYPDNSDNDDSDDGDDYYSDNYHTDNYYSDAEEYDYDSNHDSVKSNSDNCFVEENTTEVQGSVTDWSVSLTYNSQHTNNNNDNSDK